MQFQLIDRIVAVEPGQALEATKLLTLAEEYLADHFPTFPVMPGVLMLQALFEAGTWLWRLEHDFPYSVTVARVVRGAKYGSFMEPGRTLSIRVEWVKQPDANGLAEFKGRGLVDGVSVVSAQFSLISYNLRDRQPSGAELDAELIRCWRRRAAMLQQGGINR